jgi:hypothetical protein
VRRIRFVSLLASSSVCLAGCDFGSRHPSAADGTGSAAESASKAGRGTGAAPSSAAPDVAAAPNAVDEVFRRYQQALPAPSTLSEGNGVSTTCASGNHATYNVLDAAARKVPIKSDSELAFLVPWSRNEDDCIRHIAIEAMLLRIVYDHRRLTLGDMSDPEHFQFHDILGTLKSHLDDGHVAYTQRVFEGLLLTIKDEDFASVIHGKWEQDVVSSNNFQRFVEVDASQIKSINKLRRVDPKWREITDTIQIKSVHVNAKRQFVVTADAHSESDAKGYQGPERPPTAGYTFWPVKVDVAWFDVGRPGDWVKLRRVSH